MKNMSLNDTHDREMRKAIMEPIIARIEGFRMESFKQHTRMFDRLHSIEDSIEIIARHLAREASEKKDEKEASSNG